ncbi:MAG: restriction endonuclease, partial [Deltaproteobacteria bacterium]|nr:restriction endonuclease [Deltaproteobacteria bacterium]
MSNNFNNIIEKYRAIAISEHHKGYLFEKLIANFLKTYQLYDDKFAHVWLWQDFPYRADIGPSGHDIGIDLVARTVEGEYWAIQCKCYNQGAYINKHVLDSFLGPSGKNFTDDTG